jgi:hypothetical protein
MKRGWLMPLTGVAFVALLVLSFAIGGEPPDADSPVQEIVDHYVDNKDAILASTLVGGIAAVFLVFFANHLRSLMREAPTSAPILVGAGIIAVGGGIDMTISFALAEAAEDVDPTAVQALQALWDNDFMPIAIGIVIFLIASGLAIVRTGALPKWWGWIAVAIGVIGMTPIGFAAFMGSLVWVLVTSVMLAVRSRRPATIESGPSPPSG